MSYVRKTGILVCKENKDKINEILIEVNDRACRYVIETYSELCNIIKDAEDQLDAVNIPDSNKPGATAVGYGYSPQQYRSFSVVSSRFNIKRTRDGWRLTEFHKEYLNRGSKRAGRCIVTLTDEQVHSAVKNTFKDFTNVVSASSNESVAA